MTVGDRIFPQWKAVSLTCMVFGIRMSERSPDIVARFDIVGNGLQLLSLVFAGQETETYWAGSSQGSIESKYSRRGRLVSGEICRTGSSSCRIIG
jgi:hypothetical protein